MDWFERLTGFRETDYAKTRLQLEVNNGRLRSRANGKSYGIGELELISLTSLRERVKASAGLPGRIKVSIVKGGVGEMHSAPENAGALFQVASQFNLLEMVSPAMTPEHGVTCYKSDPTQGPACAVAAGAATIYRNYFAPVAGLAGQTKQRQLDGLAPLGEILSAALGQPVGSLWSMRNGYAMCTSDGLDAIAAHLATLSPQQTDDLRGALCIGVHSTVEVTDHPGNPLQLVSQAFCSALPVAYSNTGGSSAQWAPIATLVLEAAYEATLWAAVLNAQKNGSNIVLLTRLGGGAFGNDSDWIDTAMRRALRMFSGFGVDARLVSYGPPTQDILNLVKDFG